MRIIHKGFDRLELSIEANITPELLDYLEPEREKAEETRASVPLSYRGVDFDLAPNGIQGYRFQLRGGPLEVIWFFKKPNARDPWGIRVVVGSTLLATQGLGYARAYIDKTLERIGIRYGAHQISIGRADFCVDVLAPGFNLVPENFVIHSHTNRADYLTSEGGEDRRSNGKSGRFTSVTVGKSPGRQVRVKTDRHDARGIAQLVRLGWFKRVHVKSLDSQETRALLTARTFLVEKVTATENSLRAALRNFGLKMGSVTRKTWAPRARELADGNTVLEGIVDAMLRVPALLLDELAGIDDQLTAIAKSDPVTRLLMTTPGVGVIVALTFRSAVDNPDRFRRSRDVGAWAGLTPRRWQSGMSVAAALATEAGCFMGPDAVAAGLADEVADLRGAFAAFVEKVNGRAAVMSIGTVVGAPEKETVMSGNPNTAKVEAETAADPAVVTPVEEEQAPAEPAAADPAETQAAAPAAAGAQVAGASIPVAQATALAEVAAQASALGVKVDLASAFRDGVSASDLQASVLSQLAARSEQTAVSVTHPVKVAAESPIVDCH